MILPPDLTQAIREEIRSAVWTTPPTTTDDWPHDIEAERHVLASLMDSDEAYGLEPADFFAQIHARIFDLLQKTPVGDRVTILLRALKSDAWRTDHLDSVEEIFQFVPIQVGKPLRESIASVFGCSRRRSAISAARRAVAILTTTTDTNAARDELIRAAQALTKSGA